MTPPHCLAAHTGAVLSPRVAAGAMTTTGQKHFYMETQVFTCLPITSICSFFYVESSPSSHYTHHLCTLVYAR
jgi:xanthine dehydrogenase molybdopterin-binding subunit B